MFTIALYDYELDRWKGRVQVFDREGELISNEDSPLLRKKKGRAIKDARYIKRHLKRIVNDTI